MASPLIHVGLHKTGTTYLQKWVFTDAAIGFRRIGGKTVVDEAFITPNPFRFDAGKAAGLFEPLVAGATGDGLVPVISHERLSGFDLLGRHDADAIARRLHAVFPDGRILIVIREQRSMMRSAYKQRIKQWGTETPERLWRDHAGKGLRWPVPTLEAYEYHDLIACYQELFGSGQVCVLPYELLRTDPAAFLAAVCRHAGLGPPARVPEGHENPSVPGMLLGLLRTTNKLWRALGLAPNNGGPFAENRLEMPRRKAILWVQGRVPRAWSRRAERRLDAEIAALAGDRFCESNRRTEALTGLDLGSYGYMLEPTRVTQG